MRIPSGVTDQYIYFVAVDSTDLSTRETGLTSFTVYRSRNGAAAAAMTTPTINETDTTNMPGVYELLLDEDMTIGSGNDSEEMVFHITQAAMAPVTRTIELYRPKITAGNTLDVTTTGAAGIDWGNVENPTTSVDLSATSINLVDTATAVTNQVTADVTAVSGDATAANNLELDYDGTGYNKSNSTIGTCTTNTDMRGTDSAALASVCTEARLSELDEATAGKMANQVDEIRTDTGEIGAAGAGLTAVPWNAAWDAEVQSEVNDGLVALGLDHLVSAAVVGADVTDNSIIAKMVASGATADWDTFVNTTESLQALRDHIADGTNLTEAGGTGDHLTALATAAAQTTAQNDLDIITGAAGVIIDDSAANDTTISDAVWDEELTGASHNNANSAGRRLRTLQESAGVYGGYIWIDTVNGANPASPTNYEDGTSDNPVDNIADANTLATALGITRFKVAPGSSITFAASQQNQLFEGDSWTLALGGQNIDGSTIIGATVSGIGTNTSDAQYFIRCIMNACTLPGDTHTIDSAIANTQTVGEAGNYFWSNCYSAVAGNGTPNLDINNVANVNINWRHYSGGVQVLNAVGTTAMSYESDGQIQVAASCTSLTLTVRGNCSITDNGTTTSLSQDGAVNLTNISDAVWDEDATAHQTGGTFGQAIGDPGANTETMYDALITDAAGTNIAADVITVDTVVDAIKVQTDKLTFTVANQVDSNIQSINDVTITGDGSATPFNV